MQKKWEGEHLEPHPELGSDKPVRYLNAKERMEFEVHVMNGRLYDNTGKPLNTPDKGGIFAMSPEGRIYFAPHDVAVKGAFHHSSFLAGAPLAAAGELSVKNGEVRGISMSSGHYLPRREHVEQFKRELNRRGVSGLDLIPIQFMFQ
jgi:hypothetical protein